MVSILPMVDLLGNTAMDWFYILSYFRLDTLIGCPTENMIAVFRTYANRVSNRKYESMQNQSTAVFPSGSTIDKIETIPQMGRILKMFAPNAILNQQC